MKTHVVKPAEIKKEWLIVDATDQTLGRMASQISYVLRGKHKPTFTPHLDAGDNVIVINVDKIKLTGNKWRDKFYYRHTNFIGGIKATKAQDMLKDNPDRLVKFAVKGMLPSNKMGRKLLGNLKVYAGNEHPHESQKPVPMAARTANT